MRRNMRKDIGLSEIIGYMCKTDFDYELGNASGGNRVFPSIEDAKEYLKCWHGCGIVSVSVTLVEVIEPENEPHFDDNPHPGDRITFAPELGLQDGVLDKSGIIVPDGKAIK